MLKRGENVGLIFKWQKRPKSRLSGKVTYRRLHVLNKELASRDEEKHFVREVELRPLNCGKVL